MQLTPTIIRGFVQKYLLNQFDRPVPVPWFHMKLWDMCCSDARYVHIAAPRGHAKSTAITHSYTLAELLFRQSDFTIIASDTEGQAVDFLGDIKDELKDNEDLIKDFGIRKFLRDTQTEITVQMRDGHEFRVIAKGSEQKFRGLKWKNRRPRSIIFDDSENDEIVLNVDRREKFRRWVQGAVFPALAAGGRFRNAGTILHLDSFLQRQMPDPHEDGTEVHPLYEIRRDGSTYAAKFRAHTDDFSEILWPEMFPKERLLKLRDDYAKAGLLDVYSQEYLNNPIDEASAYFRRDDFLEYRDMPSLTYYASVDLAVSTAQRADYTAIAVIGVDNVGNFYVVDVQRGRWDILRVVEEIFAVNERYDPSLFFIEKGALERAISPILMTEMIKPNRRIINLHPVLPSKDKMTRAKSLQYRMRAGGVRFRHDTAWFPALQAEMMRFPKGAHDDQVDALAWIGLALNEIQEREEVEDYYRPPVYGGRNRVTGY